MRQTFYAFGCVVRGEELMIKYREIDRRDMLVCVSVCHR